MTVAGRRIEIHGTVQGVGFRPWVYRLAQATGVSGRVRNDEHGVTIEAFGQDEALDSFIRSLEAKPPRAARIRGMSWAQIAPQPPQGFTIEASRPGAERQVSIPADLATCPACLAEVAEPGNPRYRYAFTNCTDCGPRFTIAYDVPYDRARTSMAGFTMCPDCRREYEAAGDRRFHAQPNACPLCGPRLSLIDRNGAPIAAADAVECTAAALVAGEVVALKGIGGFHLACDATSERAVATLRARKQREAKPLAVMVRDLQAARALAMVDEEEARLLASVERPIVLVRRRPGTNLADGVAPGNPFVGLLLSYSPLHELLLAAVGRPLVMTSGNLTDEPIACRNDDALRRLGAIASVLLVHDREIVSRCDDSIARVIAGRPVVLRRARGYVPEPVPLAATVASPVLACGAHLKNTFCLARGRSAVLGPHIGDLEHLEAVRFFEESISRMEAFFDIVPEVVAHDLHPGYVSTEYALRRPARARVAVQHHHAHVAAAMADNGVGGPVIGIAYDGTGHGTDGTMWGGELLVADFAGFERLATLRPIPLPGGDTAIREVWRIALAAIDDAFDGEPPIDAVPLFDEVRPEAISTLRRMVSLGLNAPRARGVGRYYDAVAALVLGLSTSSFEGQAAMALDFAADPEEPGSYPFDIAAGPSQVEVIDLRPAIRAVVKDLAARRPARTIAARFQNTIIEATVASVGAVAKRAVAVTGRRDLPIVLSGGCFQNATLAGGIYRRLRDGRRVVMHRAVPPGDGGVSLGQAVVADAVFKRGGGWGEMAKDGEIGWVQCA